MISNINQSSVRSSYQDQNIKTKEQEKPVQAISKQGDTSRIDALKEAIEKGEYRVDLDALAKRIAQELT